MIRVRALAKSSTGHQRTVDNIFLDHRLEKKVKDVNMLQIRNNVI